MECKSSVQDIDPRKLLDEDEEITSHNNDINKTYIDRTTFCLPNNDNASNISHNEVTSP